MIPAQPAACGTFDLVCEAEQAISSAWEQLVADVADVADGAAELMVTMTTWRVTTESVDPTDPAVLSAQGLTRDLVALILIGRCWCRRSD